ncbi:MAG TPA: glycosyltransferase [Acidimicrobiales bacterium]|nr:glycosyltransferase [Acidimicrobiales bacterium]
MSEPSAPGGQPTTPGGALGRDLRHGVRRLPGVLLPRGSWQRRLGGLAGAAVNEARSATVRLKEHWNLPRPGEERPPPPYAEWCSTHDASPQALDAQRDAARRARSPLRFRVVVLDTGDGGRAATVRSLVRQSWGHWAATVVSSSGHDADLGTTDPRVSAWSVPAAGLPAQLAQVDGILARHDADDVHGGRAAAGEFVIFLAAGDVLAPDCLSEVATAVAQDPLLDLVYWDDDLLAGPRRRRAPRFRPSWSPDTLLGANFAGWSFAVRRARLAAAGGLRAGFGEAALWDLLLRSELTETSAFRLPRVLAHLGRRRDGVTDAGVRAVSERLAATGVAARAEAAGDGVRLRWELGRWPKASIVIPTRHNRPLLSRCLSSIATTSYGEFEVVVIDNGERTADNEAWYRDRFPELDLTVEWWDRPFNYSAVNNHAARLATGEVLVFLNDDTEVLDPDWLRELVGWAQQPGIGTAGLQLLDGDGRIQFAGTIVGLGGFADHVFQGMEPGSDSLLGPTGWYRNVLAVTGACLGVRRDLFESVGGFDERFVLCGSDVALGLDLRLTGLRSVCSPFSPVRHLESATRGDEIPPDDFFMSYWRYQAWLFGGDPYFSPNLSLTSREPALRRPTDSTAPDLISGPLQRTFQVFRQRSDAQEAVGYARDCRASRRDVAATRALHEANRAPFEPETVNWFIPELDSPFYGGINTAFRIADHLAREHGVVNRFVVWGRGPERFVRSAINAAFPAIAGSPIVFHDTWLPESFEAIPEADVSIATLWLTAYQLTRFQGTRRKFYLIQDFEPVFYPAGTMYALAEETYRLGLYGLCNTEVLQRVYEHEYGGTGHHFLPAVDPTVFHAEGRAERRDDEPVTVFVYARAGHWRNCWELMSVALQELKERLGDGVRIVAAGSWATPEGGDLDTVVKHVGLLDYRATGPLYRTCDVGLALTVSKHPSYLPLELMACGVPVVAFDSPDFSWLLRDEENCLLVERTVDGVADALERLVLDPGLRHRLAAQGLADISANHGSWDKALSGVYRFLCDPEGVG